MAAMKADEVYNEHIKPLPPAERLQLLARLARDVADHPDDYTTPRKHSILELYGLGAEIWHGVDAQEYVDEQRREWDGRRGD